MKEKTITVTEASRNFADCVNRAHYQKTTFVLLKNGVPFARLIPEEGKKCTGPELAAALSEAALSPEEASAWSQDLKTARKTLKAPADKWQ
jgi:antitoxin (DNA-binding transcriptional repressor) of toxin-antitoxin stability system